MTTLDDENDKFFEDAGYGVLNPESLPKSLLAGLGESTKGFLGQSARTGRAALEGVRPLVGAIQSSIGFAGGQYGYETPISAYRDLLNPGDGDKAPLMDYYDANILPIGQNAVDAWTPDPGQYGTATQWIAPIFQVTGALPQIIAAPSAFIATGAADPAIEVRNAGGDTQAQMEAGATGFLINAVGMAAPGVVGKTAVQKIASGVGINVGLGTINDATQKQIATDAGLPELAAGYDPFNPQARGMDALFGGVFGAKAHFENPVPSTTKAAVATVNNTQHLNYDTLPGEPKTPAAHVDHANAIAKSIDQLLKGEPVKVDKDVDMDLFTPRPEFYPAGLGAEKAIGNVLSAEGGYNDIAADRGGPTNYGISQKAYPNLDIKNLTESQAREIYKRDYWDAIGADKLPGPMQEVAFDAAVNHGVGWAKQALREAGGDPMKLLEIREQKYNAIVEADPSQKQFLLGWKARLRKLERNMVKDVPGFDADPPFTVADNDPLLTNIPEGPNDTGTGSRGEAGLQAGDRSAETASLNPDAFPVQGSETTVSTESGDPMPVKYAVVDIGDLVTSHTNALTENADYPKELQPRDREKAASEKQITEYANNIKPHFLADSPKAADGAPIIGRDKVVESGNARTIALRRAYEMGKADKYLDYMKTNAEKFGLDPAAFDGVQRPMLVRVALSEYDRVEFARQANKGGQATMSATETAMVDATRLPDLSSLVTSEDGMINARASDNFIRQFNATLDTSEFGQMMTKDGELSQQGLTRIRNAVFAKAYGDPELVAMMSEATDANVKNVLNGMLRASGEMARMRDLIDQGALWGPDNTPDLVAAARKFSQLRADKITVEQFESQMDFFGDPGLTPKSREMLRVIGEKARAPKQMAEFLMNMVKDVEALGNPRQGDMLGGRPDIDGVISRASKKTDDTFTPPETLDMFVAKPVEAKPAEKNQTLFVRMGDKTFPIESMQDAAAKYDQFRAGADAGASELPAVDIVDIDGNVVANFSYNGRLWKGERGAADRVEITLNEPEPAAKASPVTPANRVAYEAIASNPGMKVMGDDGTVKTAAEYLSESDAEVRAAMETQTAIAAATDCLLRSLPK